MRILITQSGENIFSEEEKREIMEKKFRSTTTNKIYKKKLTIEKYDNNRKEKKTLDVNHSNKNYFIPAGIAWKPDDFFSKTTSLFYPRTIRIFGERNKNDDLNKYRKIRINMKKVNFPKELQSKYDLFKIPKKSVHNIVYEEAPPLKINKFSNPDYKFTLGEIINNKAAAKLKSEIETRERVKEKLKVINEKNFRTNYAEITKMKELEEILNYKKIKGDKLELIKYLNTHDCLSDLFLKTIATSDKYELQKYDKISQTLLFNKELDKKFKLELDRKVKTKQSLSKLRITSNLNKMNKEVKLGEQILNKYRQEHDKKLNYLEKHKEIQKGWRKMGIKNLLTKAYTGRKPIINTNI